MGHDGNFQEKTIPEKNKRIRERKISEGSGIGCEFDQSVLYTWMMACVSLCVCTCVREFDQHLLHPWM